MGYSNEMGGDAMNRKGREGHKKTAEEVLGMPHVTLSSIEKIIADVQNKTECTKNNVIEDGLISKHPTTNSTIMKPSPPSIYDTVEASIKYKSYVTKQYQDMESWRRAQGIRIPPDMLYQHNELPTLSKEELEKLELMRPSTFAEASSISGLTPQSLVYLYHYVMRRNKKRDVGT